MKEHEEQEEACFTSEVRHAGKSGLWSWDWDQLMVGEELPVWMIELIKKCGLWWNRAGNVEKKTAESYIWSENNFVFNAFLYLEPVQRFENMFRIGGPGSCNNGTSKRRTNGASRIQVKKRAYATKITNVVETRTRDRSDLTQTWSWIRFHNPTQPINKTT